MFKSTDSLSRKRTRTCEGTTTRSIRDTITSAPRTELRIRESTAKSNTPAHCYTGLDSTSDSQGWLHMGLQRPRHRSPKTFMVLQPAQGSRCRRGSMLNWGTRNTEKLRFLPFRLGVNSGSDLLQRFQTLLGLLTVRAARIEVYGFLISLHSPRLHLDFQLVADLFVIHGADQRCAQQIPRLRALGVEFGCLLKRLDRLLHLPRIVERDSAIAIGLRRICRIQFRALFVCFHCFGNLARTAVDATQIVEVGRRWF